MSTVDKVFTPPDDSQEMKKTGSNSPNRQAIAADPQEAGELRGALVSQDGAPVEGANVVAIHHFPVAGGASALVRRIIPALAEHARGVYLSMSAQEQSALRVQRHSPLFRIEIKELRALLEMTNKDSQRIYDALEAIYQYDVQWERVGYNSEGELVSLNAYRSRLLSTWGRSIADRLAEIHFEMPHQILMFMLESRGKTQIDLRVNNELGSSYAIALYDICVRYLNTSSLTTPDWSIDEWITKIAGEGRYNGEYKQFNRFALKPAIARLEQTASCPFTIRPIEIKGGYGRVTHLQMRLEPKVQGSLSLDYSPLTWSANTLQTLEQTYAFTREELARLSMGNTEAEILEAIKRDQILQELGQGSRQSAVKPSQFLVALLHNVLNGAPRDAPPNLDEMQDSAQVQAARRMASEMRQKFESQRLAKIAAGMQRLGRQRQLALREQYELATRNANAASPSSPPVQAAGSRTSEQMAMAAWLSLQKPQVCRELLPNEEDNDFAVWLLLEQTKQAGS